MKSILLLVFAFPAIVYSQILFEENFEASSDFQTYADQGWQNVDRDQRGFASTSIYSWGGTEWGVSPWGVIEGNGFSSFIPNNLNEGVNSMISGSWFAGQSCCADDWLITPGIDLPENNQVEFEYKWRSAQPDWPEAHEVYIHTTNSIDEAVTDGMLLYSTCEGCFNNPFNVADFCEVTACNCIGLFDTTTEEDFAQAATLGIELDTECPTNLLSNWQTNKLDLSVYAGSTVYLFFHNGTHDQSAILIDDIVIEADTCIFIEADLDSDNDGISDCDENENMTNPFNEDTDEDGLNDFEEYLLGTNPNDVDSDGDGVSDFDEFWNGSDPLVATSLKDLNSNYLRLVTQVVSGELIFSVANSGNLVGVVEIYNSQGAILKTVKVNDISTKQSLNIGHLANGLYMVNVKLQGNVLTGKFIKQTL